MAGFQNTIIIGNVGKVDDLRYLQNGTAVVSFSVAVNKSWTQDGQKRESVTWFRVSAWRGLAETCSQYVHAGMQIMVTGEVSASAYSANDGTPRASLDITARNVQFLSRKDGDSTPPNEGGDQHTADEPGDLPF